MKGTGSGIWVEPELSGLFVLTSDTLLMLCLSTLIWLLCMWYKSACVRVCIGQKTVLGVFYHSLIFFFLDRVSHWTRSLSLDLFFKYVAQDGHKLVIPLSLPPSANPTGVTPQSAYHWILSSGSDEAGWSQNPWDPPTSNLYPLVYRNTKLSSAFMWSWGSELGSSYHHNSVLTHWAIAIALIYWQEY